MNGGIAPSHGPMYGISSVTATHAPKSTAYLSAPGTQPERAEQPHAEAGARADDQREQQLPADVARERALDRARSSGPSPGRGGKRRSTTRANRCMSSSM